MRFELAEWALARGFDEAYRVTREPSSHGGHTGFRSMVWRQDRQWFATYHVLSYGTPPPPVTYGWRYRKGRAEDLVAKLDAASFWKEEAWPERSGLDGFHFVFEGARGEAVRRRQIWCPDRLFQPEICAAAEAFRSVRWSGLFRWRIPCG